jgi:hypothetical protein
MNEKDREMIGDLISIVKFLLQQVENKEMKLNVNYATQFTRELLGIDAGTRVSIIGLDEARDSLFCVEEWYKSEVSSKG